MIEIIVSVPICLSLVSMSFSSMLTFQIVEKSNSKLSLKNFGSVSATSLKTSRIAYALSSLSLIC